MFVGMIICSLVFNKYLKFEISSKENKMLVGVFSGLDESFASDSFLMILGVGTNSFGIDPELLCTSEYAL